MGIAAPPAAGQEFRQKLPDGRRICVTSLWSIHGRRSSDWCWARHRDLKVKLPLYRDHGVREYVVWKTDEQEIVWFRLERGEFVQVAPDKDHIYRSTVFPGL